MDIKFSKMDTLKELLTESITKRLEEITLIPDAATRDLHAINEVRHQIIDKEENIENSEEVREEKDKIYEEIKLDFEVQEEKVELEKIIDAISPEEIVDVTVCLDQLKYALHFMEDDLMQIYDKKVQRQLKRIEEENER